MLEKLRKNSGFSLLEIIIVIAMLAILASVFISQFIKFKNEATETEQQTTIIKQPDKKQGMEKL